jgi:H+/Cl- antiporter ClcA
MSDDHLNPNRIRQMATLRRAAIRTRSWCVIALIGCIVGAAEFIFDAIHRWPTPANFHGILVAVHYLLSAIALLLLAIHFFRLTLRFHREAQQSALAPPTSPPDFSQLQDGSQIVKNLEEM